MLAPDAAREIEDGAGVGEGAGMSTSTVYEGISDEAAELSGAARIAVWSTSS